MADLSDRILVVISASASGAISEIDKLGRSTHDADTNAKKLSQTMKGALVAGATAFIGTGLVSFLNDSVTAYSDAAKKAGDLAKATGGSVENVSRMQAALKDAGISADTAAQMLTKFTTGASGKNKDLLDELNVTLREGEDGATDYADGMVQAVDAIMDIGDASERNRALVDLFGKSGATAFQDMIAAGVPLSEAMREISEMRVFDDEDVQKAADYDQAMDDLSASMEGVQNTIGRTLVPLISGVADAFSGFLEIMLQIPGPVYIAAGAMTAFYVASKSALVGNILSQGATLITGLAIAFKDLSAVKWESLASGMSKVGKGAGTLAVITGIFEGIRGSVSDAESLHKMVGNLEDVQKGLQGVADQRRNTDSIAGSVKEFFTDPFWNNGEKMKSAMENVAHATAVAAEETMNSADSSDAARAAAEELYNIIGTGSRDQQAANLETEAGQAAWEKYAAALDPVAQKQKEAADTAKTLADITLELVTNGESVATTWSDLADAAVEANTATLDQKQATELATIAQGEYAVSIQGVIDWERRLAGLLPDTEEALNDVQTAYKDLADTTDNPSTWGNEVEDQAGKAKTALLDMVDTLAARGWTADQIKEYLVGMKVKEGATDEMKTDIDEVIAEVEGKENEIPINLDVDPDGKAKTEIQDIAPVEGMSTTVDITTGPGWDEAKRRKEEMGKPLNSKITYETAFNPGGYEAVKARVDYLDQEREAKINLNTAFMPSDYNDLKLRKDYLTEDKTGTININVTYSPDGYGANKDRVDYLSKNRTAYIDVVVRGTGAASRTINSLTNQATTQAAAQQAAWASFAKFSQPEPIQPVNLVKVSIDRESLRATIRDELLNVRASDDLVAAMGVVA